MKTFPPRALWRVSPLALLLTCQGCLGPAAVETEETTPPFSFRSLDLEQRTKNGQPSWTLKSPEARYNIRSSVARALRPEGVIFTRGQPLYRLRATTGTVVNDGSVILLEGAIHLQRLGGDPLLVTAERAVWIPGKALMRFDLAPRVRDARNRLSSQTAVLHLEEDLLELRGQPKLERWSRPTPLNVAPKPERLEIVGTVKTLDWRPSKGTLLGTGPVTIRRRPPDSPPKAPPQVLTASRLEGNTLQQRYTLQGPVRMDDPGEKSWFRGGSLTFDTREQWLTSAAPFEGQKGELNVQGQELRLEGKPTTASIGRDCRLRQKGDALQASRCQWNWTTQAVAAEGEVVFRREGDKQLTRAGRLEGQLGASGRVIATTPGGRVVTRVQVPRQASAPRQPRVPAKPEPIVF
ncbi:MAG: LPS export ABC transporter periplasmic protein LptC [Cyanobacteriota bacterium]